MSQPQHTPPRARDSSLTLNCSSCERSHRITVGHVLDGCTLVCECGAVAVLHGADDPLLNAAARLDEAHANFFAELSRFIAGK